MRKNVKLCQAIGMGQVTYFIFRDKRLFLEFSTIAARILHWPIRWLKPPKGASTSPKQRLGDLAPSLWRAGRPKKNAPKWSNYRWYCYFFTEKQPPRVTMWLTRMVFCCFWVNHICSLQYGQTYVHTTPWKLPNLKTGYCNAWNMLHEYVNDGFATARWKCRRINVSMSCAKILHAQNGQ